MESLLIQRHLTGFRVEHLNTKGFDSKAVFSVSNIPRQKVQEKTYKCNSGMFLELLCSVERTAVWD